MCRSGCRPSDAVVAKFASCMIAIPDDGRAAVAARWLGCAMARRRGPAVAGAIAGLLSRDWRDRCTPRTARRFSVFVAIGTRSPPRWSTAIGALVGSAGATVLSKFD